MLILAFGPAVVQARWPYRDRLGRIVVLPHWRALRCVSWSEIRRRVALKALFDAETGLPNRLALEADLATVEEPAPILATAAIERFDSIRDAIGIDGGQ